MLEIGRGNAEIERCRIRNWFVIKLVKNDLEQQGAIMVLGGKAHNKLEPRNVSIKTESDFLRSRGLPELRNRIGTDCGNKKGLLNE